MDIALRYDVNNLVFERDLNDEDALASFYKINNCAVGKYCQTQTFILRDYTTSSTLSIDTKKNEEDGIILKCVQVINEHIDQVDFTVGILAHELGMSHSALFKKIKAKVGISVNKLIRKVRLEKARSLLCSNDVLSISEIAYNTGFRDVKYFRKQFKKEYKVSPSNYRKSF